MTSYLTSMDTISLSGTVFKIFDFKILGFDLDLWPVKVTWGQFFIPFESSYMTSSLTSIDTIILSRTVLEIFDFKFSGFDLDIWPLKVSWSQKTVYYSKAHIWLPISFLWTPSLYLVPFSRYSTSKFLGFDLDLRPLKVIWGQIFLYHSKTHFMTSYLTSMDNISLSRTVIEIFAFKVFRVWPRPLTSKDHLGSNFCIPFERSYMTSYLTSMDTSSLSRIVFEIFDFKVF